MKLVFDVGATNTRLGLVTAGKLGPTKHFKTDSSSAGIDVMLSEVMQFIAGQTIDGMAGGLPAQIDRESDKIFSARNLPNWEGQDFSSIFRDRLGTPVKVVNDVVIAGLGEANYGAGRGKSIVAYFTVSTGVNGVRIIDGGIDRNARGFEVGAQLMSDDEGNISTLEGLTGGAALKLHTGSDPKNIKDFSVWQREARFLARGLYNTCLHWSPEVVILGGPMMRDISITEIVHEMHKYPDAMGGWPELMLAELGDERGLQGAIALLGHK
jgi:predicted NBD/HSP70 family sugar kinase